MRATFIGLILAMPVTVWAGDKVEPLNIKPGLWETTMTTTTSGASQMPAELLSRLTAEQRAKMEAEQKVKANSAPKTRTITHKSCLTKEKLEKGFALGANDKDCTQTVVTSTASKIDVRVACGGDGMKSSGTISFEALGPESLKGSGKISVSGGGHTMNMNTSYTSKWIGRACGKTE